VTVYHAQKGAPVQNAPAAFAMAAAFGMAAATAAAELL